MGATSVSLQIRSDDVLRMEAVLRRLVDGDASGQLEPYYGGLLNGWLGVYPRMHMDLEKTMRRLSGDLQALVLLLLSFDEDDFYCGVFRDGKE
jgi:hypothetical protein